LKTKGRDCKKPSQGPIERPGWAKKLTQSLWQNSSPC